MDSLSQAISGLSSLSGESDGSGEKARTPLLDFVSAFVTAETALVGLAAQRRTGEATLVDTSQFSAALDAAAPEIAISSYERVGPAARSSRFLPLGGWFRCADGVHVSLECRDEAAVVRAIAALGAATDANPGAAVEAALSRLPSEQAVGQLRHAGLSARVVQRRFHPELFAAFPGTVSVAQDERAGEVRYPESPFVLSGTPVRAGAPLGPIGRDNPLIERIIAAWAEGASRHSRPEP